MMTIRKSVAAALITALPFGAYAQQAPRRSTVVNGAADSSLDVTLTIRGAEAATFLTVKASNADVREVFREMGQRSGATVLFAPSAAGRVTLNVDQEPLNKAMTAVASAAGLSVRRIVVTEGQAARLTPESAGILSETLALLPPQATVTDPITGRTLTVADKAATSDSVAPGLSLVYFVQGKLTPEQERLARERKTAEQAVKTAEANSTVDPKQTDAVGAAVQTLSKLPVQQRVDAMRNMQRQLWDSLSPQEREQMRNTMRDQWRQQRQQGGDRRRGNR